ncbi:hypothetical protein, partial [Streptomyces sp. sk2.1]|uniref:hypothetical protein n=1 Tax=Streptomyces sp. sk2.1 TaxID=2478959 RepID=UPI0037DDB175
MHGIPPASSPRSEHTPTNAVWKDFPIGEWAKNQRAAARRAVANEALREAGRPVVSSAGAMTR